MNGIMPQAAEALLRSSRRTSDPVAPSLDALAFSGIHGESRALRSTIDYVRSIAHQKAENVSLVGGPGTGKALFARALHNAGPNAHLPFVAFDCASAPFLVIEVELFGYREGAFEGVRVAKPGLLELSGHGSLFLENVELLPPRLQSKLMHALSRRQARRVGGRYAYDVDATIIVSTARPLEGLVAEGVFREDLSFELSAPRVSVPSLNEREEDVILLARMFLEETAREQGLGPLALSAEGQRALLEYPWPGNVRELKTVARRAAERACSGRVGPNELRLPGTAVGSTASPAHPRTPVRSLRAVEADAIQNALRHSNGDLTKAAESLAISKSELRRKIQEYDLRDSVV